MAISTPRDANRVSTILATSNADGSTVLSLQIDPVTHRIKASDGTTGSGFSYGNSQKDANRVTAVWGISSADGITPIPIYMDSVTSKLLTKST